MYTYIANIQYQVDTTWVDFDRNRRMYDQNSQEERKLPVEGDKYCCKDSSKILRYELEKYYKYEFG